MARMCPIIDRKVVYLQCFDCDEECRYAGVAVPVPVHGDKAVRPGKMPGKTVFVGGKQYKLHHAKPTTKRR